MFGASDELVERRIREARRQGAFDDLPGHGRPLELDDDRLVPEDVRVAMRILKNAGVLPSEVEALRALDGLLAAAGSDGDVAGDAAGLGFGAARTRPANQAANRMLALSMVLEARGVSLTSGAGLEYRRALMRSMCR